MYILLLSAHLEGVSGAVASARYIACSEVVSKSIASGFRALLVSPARFGEVSILFGLFLRLFFSKDRQIQVSSKYEYQYRAKLKELAAIVSSASSNNNSDQDYGEALLGAFTRVRQISSFSKIDGRFVSSWWTIFKVVCRRYLFVRLVAVV